jgi:hypothetical protein
MAMIQKRTARECLHRMLLDGFVRLQEVPKGSGAASDRVPARTCYLFQVDLKQVYNGYVCCVLFAVLCDMCCAVLCCALCSVLCALPAV